MTEQEIKDFGLYVTFAKNVLKQVTNDVSTALPDFRFPKGAITEAQMLQILLRWITSARRSIDIAKGYAKAVQDLSEATGPVAGQITKHETILEGHALLQDPNNPFARKAYTAARVMEAVKHGLTVPNLSVKTDLD